MYTQFFFFYCFHAMQECSKIRAGREDLESGTSSRIEAVAPHAEWQSQCHLCMTRGCWLSARPIKGKETLSFMST